MHRLVTAIKNRYHYTALRLLSDAQYDVNANLIAENMVDKYNHGPGIPLRTLVHLVVASNHPKLLAAMIKTHNAQIHQIEQASPTSFIKILLNRIFDTDVKTASAISNLDILFRNGASIPNAVVQQLFVDFDHLPACQDNLRSILRKIYFLKATEAFLDHIRNNRIPEARRIRDSDIANLYPVVQRLGLHGRIDPNFDAGFRGAPVLIAAELGPNAVNMFAFLRSGWRPNDFNFHNDQGVNVTHVLALNDNEQGLRWFCEEFNPVRVLQALTKSVSTAINQQSTPLEIAVQHGFQAVAVYLRSYMTAHRNLVLEENLCQENPDALKQLKKAGYDFTQKHSVNQGNALHFAVMGRIPANIMWLWNELPNDQKRLEFVLGKMRHVENGYYQMLTPLQLAQKFNRLNIIRILNRLVVQLARSIDATALRQLILAGYDLNGTDASSRSVLHYGISGDNAGGLYYLLGLMPVADVLKILGTRQAYQDDQQVNHVASPWEIAYANNNAIAVQQLFQRFRQLRPVGVNVPNNNPFASARLQVPIQPIQLPQSVNVLQNAQGFMPLYAAHNQPPAANHIPQVGLGVAP